MTVGVCGDGSTDFTADQSGAAGKMNSVLSWVFVIARFQAPWTLISYEQYVLAAHVSMIASFLFVQRAGDVVMIK